MNLKYQLQRLTLKNVERIGDSSLFQVYHQKHEKVTDHPPTVIYVKKMKNRITN